jgi:hypothetical protein
VSDQDLERAAGFERLLDLFISREVEVAIGLRGDHSERFLNGPLRHMWTKDGEPATRGFYAIGNFMQRRDPVTAEITQCMSWLYFTSADVLWTQELPAELTELDKEKPTGLTQQDLVALGLASEPATSNQSGDTVRRPGPLCAICKWPLAASPSEGCTPGNCSYRGGEFGRDEPLARQ